MDILLLDSVVPEALAWLQSRHQVEFKPELAQDPRALRKAIYKTQAMVLPREVAVTREFIGFAPMLKVVARLHTATDNIDLEACRERDIKVVQAASANVRSNAEFLLGALLLLYRRGMVAALTGEPSHELAIDPKSRGGVASAQASKYRSPGPMGRELHGSTVAILGLGPTAHTLAHILASLGVRLIGYDPAVHYSAPIWERLRIEPVSLPELVSQADAVSVQMLYASRFRGFVNEKLLAACKKGQFWVGTSRSSLFEPAALAAALQDGRIEACLLDGAEAGFASEGSPLHGAVNLHITPRLGSHTRESRLRASWYVAHRIHEAIGQRGNGLDHIASSPMDLELPGAESPSQWAEPQFIIR